MKVSEVKDLKQSVGRRVRVLRDFANIPKGSIGTISDYYGSPDAHEGISIQWDVITERQTAYAFDGRSFRVLGVGPERNREDGFGRDKEFDETEFLEFVH